MDKEVYTKIKYILRTSCPKIGTHEYPFHYTKLPEALEVSNKITSQGYDVAIYEEHTIVVTEKILSFNRKK